MWIPVAEHTPKERGQYLFNVKDEEGPFVVNGIYRGGEYLMDFSDRFIPFNQDVLLLTHVFPYPEAI
jgi:hypothetical protein